MHEPSLIVPFFFERSSDETGGMPCGENHSCTTLKCRGRAAAYLEAKRSMAIREVVQRLLVAVDNAAAVEVVRAELNRDAVAGEDADEVFTHTSGDVRKGLMLVFKLNLEQRVRQGFDHR